VGGWVEGTGQQHDRPHAALGEQNEKDGGTKQQLLENHVAAQAPISKRCPRA
jgi:hypothetical protein